MKERTLRGVYQGKRLALADDVVVTVWDGLLMTKTGISTDYVLPVGDRWLAGGLWWRRVPHMLTQNPRAAVYYPDTFMNVVTLLIRPLLKHKRLIWRRLHG